jgi:hypothetical protein
MKKIFLLLMVVIPAITYAQSTDSTAVKSDKASIYIYRGGQFSGALSNWAIFLDGKKICKISNGKYLKVEVAPGKHEIEAKIGGITVMKKKTFIDIEAEAGGTYYISCVMKQSITRARLEMTEVTKNSAKRDMEKLTEDNCQNTIDKEDEEAK